MPHLQLIENIQVGMVVYSLCKLAVRVATASASESKEPSAIDKMSGMSSDTMGKAYNGEIETEINAAMGEYRVPFG